MSSTAATRLRRPGLRKSDVGNFMEYMFLELIVPRYPLLYKPGVSRRGRTRQGDIVHIQGLGLITSP